METIEATEIAPIAPARVVRWIDRGQGFQPAYLKKNCGIVFDRYGDVAVLMLGKQQWTVSRLIRVLCKRSRIQTHEETVPCLEREKHPIESMNC